jgi:hypothetical protein
LFYAKLFEFVEFSIGPFFCSSIQPQPRTATGSVAVLASTYCAKYTRFLE